MIWTFAFAGVHSWKRDKITTRGGKPRTYRGDGAVRMMIRAHARGTRPAGWPTDGCYAVRVYYTPGDHRRHDADRVLSLIPDALKGIAWDDDHDGQIVDEGIVRAHRCEGGRVTLEIGEASTRVAIHYMGPGARAKR